MKLHPKCLLGLALASAVAPIFTGCGGQENASPTASATTATSNASGAQPATPTGPSSVTVIADGSNSAPAQCVTTFLESLRNGDQQAANGVLTAKAQAELAKTTYEMQPLGTPQGQFQIGRVGFPYEDKSVALVECVWTEPAQEGEPPMTMEIVCEVHQDPVEWKIAGLGVTIPSTAETLVLDFENAAALQATIDAATGQSTQESLPSATVFSQDPTAPGSTPGIPAQMVSGPSQIPSANPNGTYQSAPQNGYPQYTPANAPGYSGNQLRPTQPAEGTTMQGQAGQIPPTSYPGTAAPPQTNTSGFPAYPGSGGQN